MAIIPATNDQTQGASVQALQMMLSGMSLKEQQEMVQRAHWGTEATRRAYTSLQSLAGGTTTSSSQEPPTHSHYYVNQSQSQSTHSCHAAVVDQAEAENFW